MKKTILLVLPLLAFAFHTQAEMQFKHGVLLSDALNDVSSDISGKHYDYSSYVGNNPQAIFVSTANVYDGKVSSVRSFGYNLKVVPKVGFGFEFGIYSTKSKIPKQNVALIHDDGSGFKVNTPVGPMNIIVDSPSSQVKAIDFYFGGLYNFATIGNKATPYVGLGYAKTEGDWNKSYYSRASGGAGYGQKGSTKVRGSYVSAKVGINFYGHYSLELEHAEHRFHAEAFRSFFINGSNAEFDRTSLNLVYNF